MKKLSNISKLVRGIGTYTLLSLLASFFNFLFNFTLIRLLSEQQFRDLTIANNIINVFGNLFVALNIVSIAVFYISKDKQADIIKACQKVIYVLYVLLLGACIIFNNQVEQRTGLHDAIILNLTLAVIFFSIPVMVLNAIYLGANRFNRSATLNVSLAIGRLLLGVAGAAVLSSHKDAAAVGGILLVFVVVFGIFTAFENDSHRKQSLEVFKKIWGAPIHILKLHRQLVISSVVYAVTINFLLGMDIFMFGQFFSNHESAEYAAVAVIGKLIFYFIAPISVYFAAKQQELIHTKPRLALKASLVVNGLIVVAGLTLALIPVGIISLFIHRSTADVRHDYLVLSLVFNAAVVLTNHQIIEAIVGKRQRIVIAVGIFLLALNGSLFLFFDSVRRHISTGSEALVALGVPTASMVTVSLILFVATHLVRRQRRLPQESI